MDPLHHEHVCDCGARAAEDLLRKGFGIEIAKALDPLDPEGFIQIVARLAKAMARATEKTEVKILNKALQNLDVDWPNLTEEQRERVLEAAQIALRPLPHRVIPAIRQEIRISGSRTIRSVRRGERRRLPATFRTRIGVSLTARDERIVKHAMTSQSLFVRDEYGRRREAFSQQARSIVAQGLESGLGRDEIAAMLHARIGTQAGMARSRSYWNVVSAAFMNRARTYAQLASYEEAGIERYVFEAVLDEVTTDQCAALHGRTFETSKALSLYDRTAAADNPEAVKDIQPWIRVGRDDQGRRIMFTQDRAGNRQFVGEVVQTRVGQRDALPVLRNMRSNDQLAEMGLVMPPLHGNCRSTIVADV